MKNITIILILVLAIMGNFRLSAQMKHANKLFEQYKYSTAVPLYKKATEDKDIQVRKEATVRLADCYRLMNNANEARSWYAKAVTFEGVDSINYYYLGIALRSLANYDEAEKAFLNYVEHTPSDQRGKIYAQYCRDIKQWLDLSPSAEIKNATALNSSYSEFGPMFYKESLIFTTDRDVDILNEQNYLWTSFGYLDLYFSNPSYYNDFWSEMSAPTLMPKSFNQAYHDGPASFNGDFSKMYITRTLKNSTTKADNSEYRTDLLKLFIATIDPEEKTSFTEFPYNSPDYSVGHATVTKDGKMMIFSSKKPGGKGYSDLYMSRLIGDKWSEPVSLGDTINTFGNEVFPFLANDSTMFFSSDGLLGYGGLDVYETNLVNGHWTIPWNLKLPINSPYDDFSLIFHQNMTSGFLSSNRPGGLGSDDLYVFKNYKRTPPEIIGTPTISGFVKDKNTLEPLNMATVFLLNATTNEVLVLKTDSTGYYEAPITKGDLYIAKGMKPEFFNDCLTFKIQPLDPGLKFKTPRDLLLDKYSVNQIFVIKNIYYDLDKWFIRDDAKPALDSLVLILKQYPISVELGSHTDCRASDAYNIELSQKRAEAAIRYLSFSGINPVRLTARGYGETKLVNQCADGVKCTEAEHQANRRTEFKITAINSEGFKAGGFNPDVFKAGDKIPAHLLEADFFKNCLEAK
jgi:outer membrane protein OmpA-like peptidoglycan-associated protein/tetratricopeptide (TPR) repeat protein